MKKVDITMSKQEFQAIINQAFGEVATNMVDKLIKMGTSDEQIDRALTLLRKQTIKQMKRIQLPQ